VTAIILMDHSPFIFRVEQLKKNIPLRDVMWFCWARVAWYDEGCCLLGLEDKGAV